MKVSCAITAYQAGHMAPSTATFLFGAAHSPVVVMAREMDRTPIHIRASPALSLPGASPHITRAVRGAATVAPRLARRALHRADRQSPSTSQIAMDHAIGDFGRFAVMYKSLFRESPSATLRQSPAG